jgi:hypothetical protein
MCAVGGELVGHRLGREGHVPHQARQQRVRDRGVRAGGVGADHRRGHPTHLPTGARPQEPIQPQAQETPVKSQPPLAVTADDSKRALLAVPIFSSPHVGFFSSA